jgi:hypothetical protein
VSDDKRPDPRPTSWMAPDAAEAWYPIHTLTPRQADRTVHLSGQGWEVVGRLVREPESGRWQWMEWRQGLRQFVLLSPWRLMRAGVVPQGREPSAWRPVAWEVWPDPLPEPIAGPVYAPRPPGPEPDPPPLPETDDWPYPGVRLGERVPPADDREAEARVLRGLRRMDLEPKVGLHKQGFSADIPREFFHLMRRAQLAEDMADARRRGMPVSSEIGNVRSAWTPSRRDNGDWAYALDWWRQLGTFERQLFRYRAANPPFSWRQIGEREGMSGAGAHKAYGRAVAALFAIARVTAAEASEGRRA